ncbi:hypothetical protein [Mucilaginibacter sp. R-33]|uniref:hypothetical protein n=1 Tax=unclassified Mucilaginibacter TaxID=2617802 RepID=UPI003CFAD209
MKRIIDGYPFTFGSKLNFNRFSLKTLWMWKSPGSGLFTYFQPGRRVQTNTQDGWSFNKYLQIPRSGNLLSGLTNGKNLEHHSGASGDPG